MVDRAMGPGMGPEMMEPGGAEPMGMEPGGMEPEMDLDSLLIELIMGMSEAEKMELLETIAPTPDMGADPMMDETMREGDMLDAPPAGPPPGVPRGGRGMGMDDILEKELLERDMRR